TPPRSPSPRAAPHVTRIRPRCRPPASSPVHGRPIRGNSSIPGGPAVEADPWSGAGRSVEASTSGGALGFVAHREFSCRLAPQTWLRRWRWRILPRPVPQVRFAALCSRSFRLCNFCLWGN
uniref:Uncharacterized protein n=1 Tax=Aegilops tauschii subsp. strangulata TaxID=200361 RepID=A0A453C1L6_AEGTS